MLYHKWKLNVLYRDNSRYLRRISLAEIVNDHRKIDNTIQTKEFSYQLFIIARATDENYWNVNILPLINYYEAKQDEINERREKYPKELMKKRNRGIYVDYDFKDKIFHTPKDIQENEYNKLKEESANMLTTIFTLINNPLIK